jgi:hypothetical protein
VDLKNVLLEKYDVLLMIDVLNPVAKFMLNHLAFPQKEEPDIPERKEKKLLLMLSRIY